MDLDKKMEEVYQGLYRSMLSDIDDESAIDDIAERIASNLANGKMAVLEHGEKRYMIKGKATGGQKPSIMLFASDEAKYKLLGEKYRPFFIHGEVNNGLSTKENIKGTVIAFIRHLRGDLLAEEVD